MSRWRFFYHLVWATKDRRSVIAEVEDEEIRNSLLMTSEDLDLIPHAIGIMPDHVHFAVSIPPKVAVSEVVRRLKGASSHAVNHAWAMRTPRFVWQPDYGAVTFGDGSLDRVIQYVVNQRQRHAEQRLWTELEYTHEQ